MCCFCSHSNKRWHFLDSPCVRFCLIFPLPLLFDMKWLLLTITCGITNTNCHVTFSPTLPPSPTQMICGDTLAPSLSPRVARLIWMSPSYVLCLFIFRHARPCCHSSESPKISYECRDHDTGRSSVRGQRRRQLRPRQGHDHHPEGLHRRQHVHLIRRAHRRLLLPINKQLGKHGVHQQLNRSSRYWWEAQKQLKTIKLILNLLFFYSYSKYILLLL